MPDLFGVPFAELTLPSLTEFLANAEHEPLLWEAKGTKLSAHEVRRQCGGFANSDHGGYLILGANETTDGWRLDGVKFPGDEPTRWVTTCLQEGVRLVPRYNVQSFATGAGHVAVVEIEPLTAGPCIVRGTVFERVAGSTIAVRDASRLHDLVSRGRQAHERAERAASDVRDAAFASLTALDAEPPEDEPQPTPHTLRIALGVAPATPHPDVSKALFRTSTRDLMLALVEERCRSPFPPIPQHVSALVQQDVRQVLGYPGVDTEPRWTLTASWDGSAGVGISAAPGTGSPDTIVTGMVQPTLTAALAVLERLRARGPIYLRLSVVDWNDPRWPDGGTHVERGPLELTADALDMPYLIRELKRATGVDAAEAEAGEDA